MLGAIAGDIIGSRFERAPNKTKDFELFTDESTFTDDTVLTVAVAQSILTGADYAKTMIDFTTRYYNAGFSGRFLRWANENCFQSDDHVPEPYYSFGNGSAMRVSPVGFAFNSIKEVLGEARKTAEVSHNHPEGIKGAQATALAIFLARTRHGKKSIKEEITQRFGYELDQTLDEIRPEYSFDVTCQGSVPQSIISFLESTDCEDAVRNAISLGGDSDTMACIAGGIAQAFYGSIPDQIVSRVIQKLPTEFIDVITQFDSRFF